MPHPVINSDMSRDVFTQVSVLQMALCPKPECSCSRAGPREILLSGWGMFLPAFLMIADTRKELIE